MTEPGRFQLVDSTLREGEQFALARFDTTDRLRIAGALDEFGVDWIELTSPSASPRHARDLARICRLGLRARVAAHVRCTRGDVEAALAAGVDGLHLFMGASWRHHRYGHGRGPDEVLAEVGRLLEDLRGQPVEVRFSCEDTFRTPWSEVLRLFQTVERHGVDRVGLADTVGSATPREVAELIGVVRRVVGCDIEFHGHNDAGCAVANAHAALEAGATHVDVTVLGIGERNGITPLSGLVARLHQTAPASLERYRLDRLFALDALVAERLGIEIPFNSCITGSTAFTHKAGLHAKAVLGDPTSYESLDPAAFGREREILVAHPLTGRHALAHRARALGIDLDGLDLPSVARSIKQAASERSLSPADVDRILLSRVTPTSEGNASHA